MRSPQDTDHAIMTNEQYIQTHKEDDVRRLALAKHPEGIDLQYCLQQIEGWQTARRKLPRWAGTDGVVFPRRLSLEQCSSEATALYKARIVERLLPEGRDSMADLTAGMGVDFSYLAPLFERAVYVERDRELCDLSERNMPLLGVENAVAVCREAEEFVLEGEHFSMLYLDPARRDKDGRKVSSIEHCSPDVGSMAKRLLEISPLVMVKLSPMLDIHDALTRLPEVAEIHVVGVDGECKELLLVMRRSHAYPIRHVCADLGEHGSEYAFEGGKAAAPTISPSIDSFLYEPNACILKAGIQDSLCKAFGIGKLHPFSHLFTSDKKVEGFPGRSFQVVSVSDCSKKSIRNMAGNLGKANLTVRNFPSTVAELRKKWKLAEGGEDFLFATTVADGSFAIIHCKKA